MQGWLTRDIELSSLLEKNIAVLEHERNCRT